MVILNNKQFDLLFWNRIVKHFWWCQFLFVFLVVRVFANMNRIQITSAVCIFIDLKGSNESNQPEVASKGELFFLRFPLAFFLKFASTARFLVLSTMLFLVEILWTQKQLTMHLGAPHTKESDRHARKIKMPTWFCLRELYFQIFIVMCLCLL